MENALDEYFSALVGAAEIAAGAPLGGGTVIAPEEGRVGSFSATSYPTPSGTIIWCDPALVGTLRTLLGGVSDRAITSDEFVDLALDHDAKLLGFGHNRVLVGEPTPHASPDAGLVSRRIDRNNSDDRVVLRAFASVMSDDELEEADLDLDNLDPFIVGLLDGDGLVGYASGRPSEIDQRFDDIGVLTHPAHRRRGHGARTVREFIVRRVEADPGRLMMYRCAIENVASNAIAESVGFTMAHTIGAVRFPDPTSN